MIRAELSEVLWFTKQGLACWPANNARGGNPVVSQVFLNPEREVTFISESVLHDSHLNDDI